MNYDEFDIESDDVNKAIFHLLISTQARLRALQEFVIVSHHEKTGEDFDSITSHFDKSLAFHKNQVLKNLYEHFASLKDVLPKKENE